jgi:hypothetical protein
LSRRIGSVSAKSPNILGLKPASVPMHRLCLNSQGVKSGWNSRLRSAEPCNKHKD